MPQQTRSPRRGDASPTQFAVAESVTRAAAERVGAHMADRLSVPKGPAQGADAEDAPDDPDISAFHRSKLGLPKYCASKGLDAVAFRKRLTRWRERFGKGRA